MRWWKLPHLPYQGEYKSLKTSNSNEPVDEYDIVSLSKRLNISLDDMKEMSFVSLMNTLISSVESKETTQTATQEDIERYFG